MGASRGEVRTAAKLEAEDVLPLDLGDASAPVETSGWCLVSQISGFSTFDA